ncbi:hypothetical protein CFE70_004967 [Pyrenophora teres f. teres 0-1]
MSRNHPDGPPAPVSCTDEKVALELRIAELEREKAHLTDRASSAETSLTEANTRAVAAHQHAATCEAQMKAATARAQARYTDKLLANNESRNLRKVIETQKFDLRDYHIKSGRTFQYLTSRIAELEAKGGAGRLSEHLVEMQKFRADLKQLRNELSAALTEHSRHKAEWKQRADQLNAVVIKLNKELVAEQAKVAATAEGVTARIEACKAEMSQVASTTETQWLAKEQNMIDHNNHLKRQLNEAHKQIQLQHQQLQMAISFRSNQQNPWGSPQGPQNSLQQSFNSNKRRRYDSISTADVPTQNLQHARTQPLLSNSDSINPNSDFTMQGHHYIMSPHGTHRRQVSQLSNGSSGPMTPMQRFRQGHNGSSTGSSVGHDSGSPGLLQPQQQQLHVDYISHPEHSQLLQDVQSSNPRDQYPNQAEFHDQVQNTMRIEAQDWTMARLLMDDVPQTHQSYGADIMDATLQFQQQEMLGDEHSMQDFNQFTTSESLISTSHDTQDTQDTQDMQDMQDMQSRQQQAPVTPEVAQSALNTTASSRSTPAPRQPRDLEDGHPLSLRKFLVSTATSIGGILNVTRASHAQTARWRASSASVSAATISPPAHALGVSGVPTYMRVTSATTMIGFSSIRQRRVGDPDALARAPRPRWPRF